MYSGKPRLIFHSHEGNPNSGWRSRTCKIDKSICNTEILKRDPVESNFNIRIEALIANLDDNSVEFDEKHKSQGLSAFASY